MRRTSVLPQGKTLAQAEFTSAEHGKRHENPKRGRGRWPRPLFGRQLLALFSKASGSDEADDKLLLG